MSREVAFIDSLRALAADPAARALVDDAAVLELDGRRLVLTHDMIVEGVHYLPSDPPDDVAWKLVAVNLSDLAATGARPIGVLLGYMLNEAEWDRRFAAGLALALGAFGLALLGGDTVAAPGDTPRALALTAIGEARGPAPSRAGGKAGDQLWVSGAVGDAGLGLRIARGELDGPESLLKRYRRPRPRLEAGEALAPLVSAMMDVSDGLLIDTRRLAAASALAARIDLDHVPLSQDFLSVAGDDRAARLAAATSGDDYELLFAASPDRAVEIQGLADRLGLSLTPVGQLEAGHGLSLFDETGKVELPDSLGYQHG